MLVRLISLVIDLCRFRSGPQDFPHAPPLAIAVLVIQLGVLLLRVQVSGAERDLLPELLAKGVFAVASVWIVLRLRELQARYWQTLLALVSVELVFTLLLFPLMMLADTVDPQAPPPLAPLFGWLGLLGAAWLMLVFGHVWRHALNVLFPVGVLVAVALLMVEAVLMVSLFPRPAE
jgi:hypothetical protein